MSIWYQYDITVIGEEDRKAIGRFFNLDPEDIHFIDSFEFSFGQKNVPGLRLGKLVEQNPDLIFLVQQSTDYDITYWIERFNISSQKVQMIFISRETYGEYGGSEFNKKLISEYAERHPYLMDKIASGERHYEWAHFFVGQKQAFRKAADMLNRADEYKEMTNPALAADVEFDNACIVEE